jgi:hypothetical protein
LSGDFRRAFGYRGRAGEHLKVKFSAKKFFAVGFGASFSERARRFQTE